MDGAVGCSPLLKETCYAGCWKDPITHENSRGCKHHKQVQIRREMLQFLQPQLL